MALRLAIACVALLGLAACGDDDGGDGITIRDSGVTDSGGGGSDAGGGGTDAGGGICGTLSGAGVSPLPATCMPRCTSSTLDAFQACPNDANAGMCRSAALMADTYPRARLMAGAETVDLNCNLCFNIQANSCVYDSCPSELEAYFTCANMAGADCSAQEGAVDACITANMTPFQSCFMSRAVQCFDLGGSTFAPDFSPRTIPALSRDAVLDLVRGYNDWR